MRWIRTLAIVVATLLVTTSCAHRQNMSREQRRECRRLRTKAALTGVGVTVGMAVVATVLVVAVAASRGGNIGSGGGGSRRRRDRRRERRRLRHEVCYGTLESTPEEPPDEGAIVAAPPAPVAPADATGSTPAAPPTEAQLAATFEGIQDDVRECLGVGEVVQIDVSINGPTGRVTGYGVQGMVATDAQRQCLGAQLARMRFQPFYDEMRVRFALDLGWVPPPPGSQP